MKLNHSLFIIILFLVACQERGVNHSSKQEGKSKISMSEKIYGTVNGQEIIEYKVSNAKEMSISVINYGGIITKIEVPDRDGQVQDVALGFDNLAGYTGVHPYFGALVGRYGNRIAKGQFSLDDKTYNLAINNDPNSLHGGIVGFDKKVWKIESIEIENASGVKLTGRSSDGEEGFPGNLDIEVSYLLNDQNELIIEYKAVTDQSTIVNLTNHSYFNLKGEGKGDILDHQMTIRADRFNPVDQTLIPTGELKSVKNTPFDFTQATSIGARINDPSNEQIKYGGGYDHNWVLNENEGDLKLAATVYESTSGRVMEVLTTEPGVQFYTGNFLEGSPGKAGRPYEARFGFCLETQHFPDSPNQAHFPSTELKPGETYQSKTVYRFSTN